MILASGYYRDKCFILPFLSITAGRDTTGRVMGFQIEAGWMWWSMSVFFE